MKSIILFIFILSFICLSADFYTEYIDSLENAFSQKDIEKMLNLSNVIIEYDSSRAEGFYYKAYAYYLSNMHSNADDIINMSMERERNIENIYLKLLIARKLNAPDYNVLINRAYDDFPMDYRIWDLKSAYFYNKGKEDSALIYALRVIKESPSHENALYRAGAILYNNGKYNDALNIATELVRYHNESIYKLMLGKLYMKLNRYNDASAIFNTLVRTDMIYSGLKYLSYAQYQSGSIDSCIEILFKMRKIFPDSLYPIENLTALLSLTGNESIADSLHGDFEHISILGNDLMSDIANAYFKHNMYDRASYYYSELMIDSSYKSKPAVQTFFYTSQYAKSLELLNRYRDTSDTSLAVFVNRFKGNNYFSLGNYAEAELYFSNALQLSPSDTLLMFNLANSYYMNRKDALLREMIDSIAQDKPEFSQYLRGTFIPAEADTLNQE